jgi:phosphohistidine phosphatase SixA
VWGTTVTIYLVRHAKAGNRRAWQDEDYLRPLPPSGQRQAKAIVETLAGAGVERTISSPYVRCRQTIDPLAQRLRLPVELSDALAEGAPVSETMRLIDKVVMATTVLCTHGDVIENMLGYLREHEVPLDDDRLEKGSIWVLETNDTEITAGHYTPPPA